MKREQAIYESSCQMSEEGYNYTFYRSLGKCKYWEWGNQQELVMQVDTGLGQKTGLTPAKKRGGK